MKMTKLKIGSNNGNKNNKRPTTVNYEWVDNNLISKVSILYYLECLLFNLKSYKICKETRCGPYADFKKSS